MKKGTVLENGQPKSEGATSGEDTSTQLAQQPVTISLGDISALVAASVSAALEKANVGRINESGSEDITNVRAEDVLAEPVAMYAPSVYYVIADIKTKNGLNRKLPHGLGSIRFDFEASKMQRGGKEANIQIISKYLVRTKPLLEALRSDVRHNVAFFEGSGKKAFEIDTKLTRRTIEFLSSLNQKDQATIVMEARLQFKDVDVSKFSLNDLRVQLAQKYAREEYERDNQKNVAMLLNSIKETKMLAGTSEKAEDVEIHEIKS